MSWNSFCYLVCCFGTYLPLIGAVALRFFFFLFDNMNIFVYLFVCLFVCLFFVISSIGTTELGNPEAISVVLVGSVLQCPGIIPSDASCGGRMRVGALV
jgi:hypothetical protein